MLEVRLLGQFDVRRDGAPLVIPSRLAQSLFAYLLLSAGTPHRREKLAGLFWPDTTDENARRSLRQELWRLRKTIESNGPCERTLPCLLVDDLNLAFNSHCKYWLDVAALTTFDFAPASAREWRNALALYRGELLPGFFDEWIVPERERVRAFFEQKIGRLLDLLVEANCWDDVLEWSERWIGVGRSPEPAFRALMIAYGALGDRSKMAAAFERCLQALRDDLNLEPSPQTRALFRQLSGDNTLFRFNALPAPQVPRSRVTNLPISLTPFIGRERESSAVLQLLSTTRLLTLTGSGGCGKTRLALQVAAGLKQFRDGVWLVDLAPLADPSLVPQAVAAVFGLQESGATPFVDLLQTFFHGKNTLWVLDNCEHLIQACAELCDTLLRTCPDLNILATSREPLNIAGETTFRIPSLALPDLQPLPPLDLLSRCESVRLFIARARAARPDFQLTDSNARLIAQICHRLDGMPLAIELAAARVNAFSIEEIAARLDDRFRLLTSGSRTALPRYQTLRASIDWSYDLLSNAERVLFQRLAVFAGGFTLEAVESVCGEGCEGGVFEVLWRLVQKSLVVGELGNQPRYRLLETIRQYAREKLAETADRDAVRDRHLDYFMYFAEGLAPQLHGLKQTHTLELFDSENDNWRAALEWSLGEGRVQKGLRLAGALAWFWERRGYWSEGSARVHRLLNQPEAAPRNLIRANGLVAASLLTNSQVAAWVGGSPASRSYLEEAIAIAREHGRAGERLLALALTFLSNIVHRDDPAVAQSQYDEAWAIVQELNVPWIRALLLHQRAHWYEHAMDNKAARQAMEDSMTLFHSLGDKRWEAILLSDLAQVSFTVGDKEDARRRLEIVLPYFRQTKDRQHICFALLRLVAIARLEGHYALAKEYCVEGIALARELGSKLLIAGFTAGLGFIAVHNGELDSARPFFVESLAMARELDVQFRIANALLGFASIAVVEMQVRRAVPLFAFVDSMLEGKRRDALSPENEVEYAKYLAFSREQLEDAAFSAAWAEGRSMTKEQAIEYALAEPRRKQWEKPSPPAAKEKFGGLTARECEVAILIAQGKSNPQIAVTLVVTERTVTTHITHILTKLGFTSRTQIAVWATAQRLTRS